MPRMIGKLTALKVQKARKAGMYADGGGLYLRVTESGAKNWVFRFMLNGRARWMGMGPLALYGLQDARAKALDARRRRYEGADPIEARKTERMRARLKSHIVLYSAGFIWGPSICTTVSYTGPNSHSCITV
jgi:hypothetical protein